MLNWFAYTEQIQAGHLTKPLGRTAACDYKLPANRCHSAMSSSDS
jgi:hypothetical protein